MFKSEYKPSLFKISTERWDMSNYVVRYIVERNNFKLMITQLKKWGSNLMIEVGISNYNEWNTTKDELDMVVKEVEAIFKQEKCGNGHSRRIATIENKPNMESRIITARARRVGLREKGERGSEAWACIGKRWQGSGSWGEEGIRWRHKHAEAEVQESFTTFK